MRKSLFLFAAIAGCSPALPSADEQPTFRTAPIVEHDLAEQKKAVSILRSEVKRLGDQITKLESRLENVEYAAEEAIRPGNLKYHMEEVERDSHHFDYRN